VPVIVATVPLNLTMLLAAVVLKLVPVIVTGVATGPDAGLKFVMVGEEAAANVNPARVAVPPGVVTLTLPEVPDATTAVILVAETTLNEVAAVPPKLTAVAPVKLVPVIVTVAPIAALVGVKEVIVGAGTNVNPTCVAVPPGVVTLTLPEVPAATTAVMLVAETTLNDVAAVPPKLTAVAPVKLVPVIVTVAPIAALVGVKEVIVGAGTKVNPTRVAVPPGVVTLTLPEVPAATTAVMLVAETTLNDVAAVPPKLTAVAPVKLVPVMVTVAPTAPEVGVKLVIVGTRANKTVLRNIETVALLKFATARSALPSPSRSPMETEKGSVPVVKSTLAAKELRLMLPTLPVLRNTDTVLLIRFDTARSALPSPSRSPMETKRGCVPVVKSTLAA